MKLDEEHNLTRMNGLLYSRSDDGLFQLVGACLLTLLCYSKSRVWCCLCLWFPDLRLP